MARPAKIPIPTLYCRHCNGVIDMEKYRRRRGRYPMYCCDGHRIIGERNRRKSGEIRSFASGGMGFVEPASLTAINRPRHDYSEYMGTPEYEEMYGLNIDTGLILDAPVSRYDSGEEV